jgi:hypothetical protein
MSGSVGVLLLLATGHSACAQEGSSALEGIVRQWVELNGEIAAESRGWDEQKVWLETRIALLETERDGLQARADTGRERAGTGEKSRAARSAGVGRAETELKQLELVLDVAEARARAWLQMIPEPLQPSVRAPLDAMSSGKDVSGEGAVTHRLQAVVAFYVALEELQGGVHLVQELVPTKGDQPREMDVLYLGLSQAYAVSAAGTAAAVGHPRAGGWSWASTPDSAEDIRRAVRIYRKEIPAHLVVLPVQVPITTKGGAQ